MAKKKTNQAQKNQHKKTDQISGIFDVYLRRINSEANREIEYYKKIDFDNIRLKRRISAIERLMPKVKGIVLSMWPDISHDSDIDVDWAHANAQILSVYDLDERNYNTILGAAIWILDQLHECGKLEDAMRLMPKGMDRLSTVELPLVRDPNYSEELLQAMVYILQNRNRDCENRTNVNTDIDDHAIFMDLNTARKKHLQKVPSRAVFEAILDLIPDDRKKEAMQEYEDSFWDWIKRYYRCWIIYHKKRKEIELHQERLNEIKTTSMLATPRRSNGRNLDKLESIFSQDESTEEFNSEYFNLSQVIKELWTELRSGSACSVHQIEDIFGKEIANIWYGFSIHNPYRSCFAFLYLVDSGSDLPWLYFPGMGLFSWIGARLPWYSLNNLESRQYRFTDDDLYSQIDFSDCESWYELQYREYLDYNYFQYRNLAQVICNTTGCLVPRKTKQYHQVFPVLQYYSSEGNLVANSLNCIMSTLEHSCQQIQYVAITEEAPDISGGTDANAVSVTEEEVQRKISAMKSEIARLKDSVIMVEKQLRVQKEKYAILSKEHALEHQELSDLRSLIYNQQESTYESDLPDQNIQFPYMASHNIIVYGGHDSWLREIRQILPNVRFIGKDQKPNAELIRNADMVWVQPNALSHAYYYKIINEVRKYQIPLRYFTYASAVKCAEDLVVADKAYINQNR